MRKLILLLLCSITLSKTFSIENDILKQRYLELSQEIFSGIDSGNDNSKSFITLNMFSKHINDLYSVTDKFFKDNQPFKIRNDNNAYVKKRVKLCEPIAWELCLLLDSGRFMPPTILYYNNKDCIYSIQKNIPCHHGPWIFDSPPKAIISKVSLYDYWHAHLLAYILGVHDLSGNNYGVTNKGQICFFDIDASFLNSDDEYYINYQALNGKVVPYSIFINFQSLYFDWHHFKRPLTCADVHMLKELFIKWSDFPNLLNKYLLISNKYLEALSDETCSYILKRLKKIEEFNKIIMPGMAFIDFYEYILPGSMEMIKELEDLSGKIGPRKGIGSGLFFASSDIHYQYRFLTTEQINLYRTWLLKYCADKK
jgi:hypothetical protein